MLQIKVIGVCFQKSALPKWIIQSAGIHIHSFNRNIQFISNDKLAKTDNLQIKDDNVTEKPLTLLYSWMLAKDHHTIKYAKFYTDQGFNVLRVKVTPFDLLRPTKGSQVVAGQVLDFLHLNPSFSPLLIHGFSVGAYVFNESMAKAASDLAKHGPILKRFAGQIWDSPVDVNGIPSGLSKAVTKNKVLQKSLEKYLQWYLKFNRETATRHYERSSQMMHANTLGCPGLFIFSESDVVSDPPMNMHVVKTWEKNGFPVFTKCFEKSAHVSHYTKYKTEYLNEISAFWEKVGVLLPQKNADSASVP